MAAPCICLPTWEHVCHQLPVERVVCAGVVTQPQNLEVVQTCQVLDLTDFSDVIFTQVQFLLRAWRGEEERLLKSG